MRVLVTSPSAIGHVHPMVPTALALQARGHEVRWATGADTLPYVEAARIDAIDAGLTQPERVGTFMRTHGEEFAAGPPEQRGAVMFPKLFGGTAAPAMLDALLPMVDEWRPDLVLHDTAEFAAPIVAAKLGVPNVAHSFGGLAPPPFVQAAGVETAPLWERLGLEQPAFAGAYEHLYLDILPPSLQHGDLSHIPHVQLVRPVPFAAETGSGGSFELDDADGPLVYLTFGTVFNENATLRAAVDALADFDVQVLLTVGPSADPSVLGDFPANVRVERYVPQTDVLPRASFVVSHAGSGTMLASLSHGLPQLSLPQGADQFRNADAVAQAGAGLWLHPEKADREAIAGAFARLRDEPSFREAAQRLAREIESMPSPDDTAAAIEALVD